MFILRSVFWLTAAFFIVQPSVAKISLPQMQQSAAALGEKSLATGKELALMSINSVECETIDCHGSKILATAVLKDNLTPEQTGVINKTSPYPAPRIVR